MRSKHKSWAAYQKAFRQASRISALARAWPGRERYALTDQILRSSRSVCAALGEAAGKRRYPKHFVAKVTDARSENYETEVHLDIALHEGYLSQTDHQQLLHLNDEVSRLLAYMEKNYRQFTYPDAVI